jgi:hypothetical protein
VADSAADAALVRVAFSGEHAVEFSMVGAADVGAVVDGARVVYREVQPGVDVVEYLLRDGVKEEIVLHERPKTPRVFAFELSPGRGRAAVCGRRFGGAR